MTIVAGPSRLAWTLLALTLLVRLIAPVDLWAQEVSARRFDLTVRNAQVSAAELARPARGAPTLRILQGDAVEISWSVDAAMDLHLHGYKLEVRAAPGIAAVMPFRAHATGRFPVEIHDERGRHRPILYIEVHPR